MTVLELRNFLNEIIQIYENGENMEVVIAARYAEHTFIPAGVGTTDVVPSHQNKHILPGNEWTLVEHHNRHNAERVVFIGLLP
jgi:hypothetical protein